MNFIADTHALVWWFTDSPRLSSKASDVLKECEKGENVIFIPSIVLAEALSIFEKKRIAFNFKKLFKKINESENFIIIPLDSVILRKMIDLKEVPELHDKIIVSTARYLDLPIITKDKFLLNLSHIKTIW
jgi:PIN domain nuclease of toxin-antitoxin system